MPSLCAKDRGTNSITVSFFDGTKADSNDLVPFSNGGLDLFFVGVRAGEWTEARLGLLGEEESEMVLKIAPFVNNNSHRQRTYTSHIMYII